MSAQTGIAPPSGPASRRFVDRARFRVDRWRTDPNPIWIRELKQAARLVRTPVILMVIALAVTFLTAAIGGIMSTNSAPADTGVVLFQVYFSLAFFVVALVGPAVAANSIASEREGRTWEAVVLTGIRPAEISRGKFLAAYTAIGMYIVMLAPVGALSFLFGGVTATEVVVAFVFLFLIALLSVAFGLAISSKMTSLRGAIVVTLLLAFPISIFCFTSFGVGLSWAAHKAWPQVQGGPPVWLPSAYGRAPFGVQYFVFLFALPVSIVALPAWFLYEVTIANLSSVTDDRTTGLKRWFLVAVPAMTISAGLPIIAVTGSDVAVAFACGIFVLMLFFGFNVFLFQGDPIGPSRRVKVGWERARAGRFKRFLGPGVMKSGVLMLIAGLAGGALLTLFAFIYASATVPTGVLPGFGKGNVLGQIGSFALYVLGFHVFVVGAGTWLRSRTSTAVVARVVLLTICVAVSIGPWIVAAIAGIIGSTSGSTDDSALLVAAPSPVFAFVMLAEMGKATGGGDFAFVGGLTSVAYAAIGLGLLAAAARRCKKILDTHEATMAEAERMLAEEDAAARRVTEEAGRKVALDEKPFADPTPAHAPRDGDPPSTVVSDGIPSTDRSRE